ncbi:MAG: acetolactate synthase small subunit [Candidatus Jacksonbacteria bacterium RIFOXYC2_FULL_44_29]|nr:MAG: Acetolactate synthase, small subunit [Parcubacteria group bacterium GW2011_GWA2_42_28]KKT55437.1 MAG: Acetolactate synthase, small subunit [Parcubacteria group bacterium GW2011_GWC2_44_22]OGY75252.1 MAG: acetolactate synthase small subunit [Candidatus Jacksonbacteria bacterium RIFOXYA2_FULL_43_12]OGY75955.1 MAG: acetolactate synthase small subunit [Candidatus Jacksonbacteria bacterium RIFOXYB2_FULL_44_15]OGY77970.1 MAG: acetolactate synthase small subunit [Candidatus Jacksonbacteria bac
MTEQSGQEQPIRHIIVAKVENKFGVLARVTGLFSGRGYNIDSLAVGETEDPTISKMCIVVSGNEMIIEQIIKQLNKLIDTIEVHDLTDERHVERGLALIRQTTTKTFSQICHFVDIFKAEIVDVGHEEVIISIQGSEQKIDDFIDLLRPHGLLEVMRSGTLAMKRSIKAAEKPHDLV